MIRLDGSDSSWTVVIILISSDSSGQLGVH